MVDYVDTLLDYSSSIIRVIATSILVVILLIIVKKQRLGIERELSTSSLRGFIQLMLMASVILIIFELDSIVITIIALMGMILIATHFSGKRSAGLPDNVNISFWSIFAGSSIIIVSMTLIGALPFEAQYLIPLGGMVIGNSMNVTSLAMDRLKGEIRSNSSRIEAYLALGSTSEKAIRDCVHQSVRSSLIPNIDGINTLGIIWIPGLMSGMLISGVDPYVAAAFQITISIMILGASMISSLVSTHLVSKKMFTEACQLIYID
jgi:putative ABC transport system permease protein